MIRRAGVPQARGFTVLEILFVVAVMAILGAVALPAYRDYLERAHLAEVMVQYDAMREQAQIAAQGSNQDLCNWKITWTGRNTDANTAAVEAAVVGAFKALDPKRWKPAVNHFTSNVQPGRPPAPLTVQFGGVGAQGVAGARLLAREFERIGAFHRWERESPMLATFTAFLGPCQAGAAQPITVATAATGAPKAAAKPQCAPAQQLNADQTTCVAKICGSGLVLDPASGACNPGCKPGEFEPTFMQNRGTSYQAFSQPGTGPHTCFSAATQSCPSDRPIPTLKDGALVCEPFDNQSTAAGSGPKPTACSSIPNANPFMDIKLAQKLPYKAHDCGGQPGDLCEFQASPAGAVTCPAGSFPSLKLVNDASGSRTMERGCMSVAECKSEWWGRSSQSPECTGFDPSKGSLTADFSCTYCCAGDNCNGFDLSPDGNSANVGACPVNPAQLLKWD